MAKICGGALARGTGPRLEVELHLEVEFHLPIIWDCDGTPALVLYPGVVAVG